MNSEGELRSKEELRARVAMLRSEFDAQRWRKARADEKFDRLAKELEEAQLELAVVSLTADITEHRQMPTFMTMEAIDVQSVQ